jgi:hypothetical protein
MFFRRRDRTCLSIRFKVGGKAKGQCVRLPRSTLWLKVKTSAGRVEMQKRIDTWRLPVDEDDISEKDK